MLKLPVAVQIYSVREDAAKDFQGTLQKIKDMGYQGVELAGLYGLPAEEVRRMLDLIGLAAISAHVPIHELMADAEGTIDNYVTIGCSYIAIPHLDEDMRPGTPGFLVFVASLPAIARKCRDKGLTLLYHNHDFEFVRMENGEYGLDYLYQAVPADLLQTELDTCWINVAGESPAAYIRKYANRCPVVHFKDFYMGDRNKGGKLYELIGTKVEKSERNSTFEFRPIGQGLQNVPEMLQAAQESGAKWIIVEQDLSVGRTPLEAIAMSIKYLRSL